MPRAAGLDLRQPARGHRFSIDSLLLAGFVRPRPRERILDAGAGVGVVGLLLAVRHPTVRVTGIEIQHGLVRSARANIRRNGLAGRVEVVRGDVREHTVLVGAGSCDRVVANPPYHARSSGRTSPDPGRASAREELTLSLPDLARCAAWSLRFGGALDLILPVERMAQAFRELMSAGLEPKALRLVSPFPGAAPRRCLVHSRRGGRPGLVVLPGLIVHKAPGRYSAEVGALVAAGRRTGRGMPENG